MATVLGMNWSWKVLEQVHTFGIHYSRPGKNRFVTQKLEMCMYGKDGVNIVSGLHWKQGIKEK